MVAVGSQNIPNDPAFFKFFNPHLNVLSADMICLRAHQLLLQKKMPKMSSNLQGSLLKSLFSPPPSKVAS